LYKGSCIIFLNPRAPAYTYATCLVVLLAPHDPFITSSSYCHALVLSQDQSFITGSVLDPCYWY